jgi:steroid delta-isomerase-like uncharacterized protein
MSTEENKALARRAYEALNQRDLAAFYELITPGIVLHNASMTIQGLEAYKQFVSMYFAAFPDLHFTVEDIIADGDKVVFRTTGMGTHKGDLMGIAPTGKQVTVSAINIIRVVNGKTVEEWLNNDDLGLLQQLGVVPAPGQAS